MATKMASDGIIELGRLLRSRREELGLSTYQAAERAGVDQTTICRFEAGAYQQPKPEKLRLLAEALDLNLTTLMTLAGYPVPRALPSLPAYLRLKYRHLPAPAQADLQAYVQRLEATYGLDADGPSPGEDEAPEQP